MKITDKITQEDLIQLRAVANDSTTERDDKPVEILSGHLKALVDIATAITDNDEFLDHVVDLLYWHEQVIEARRLNKLLNEQLTIKWR